MGSLGDCCCVGCELGEDSFTRVDANPPTGQWHEISGNWSITEQYLTDNSTPGILATTICHPTQYDEGSFIANFRLMELRSREEFRIRAGNPQLSPYEVSFEPLNMDTPLAAIRVTVHGPGGVSDSVQHPWPTTGYGSGVSADEANAFACYQPGVSLRASIGSFGGQIPVAQICIGGTGSNCYTIGMQQVGNFSFLKGAFDNWEYWATATDDLTCIPCGCLCLKGMLPEDRFDPEKNCFPDQLMAIFTLMESNIDASACPINDFEVLLDRFGNNKTEWISGNQTLCSTTFALKLSCDIFDEGNFVFRALSLQLLNGVDNQTPAIVFQWQNPDFANGESASVKFPDPELSTCEPISLVYDGLKLACFFGACGNPGQFGQIPFCCPEICLPTCPSISYRVTVVAA
jgi:hypothetical protein